VTVEDEIVEQTGNINVSIGSGIAWTITGPGGTYTGVGAQTITGVPYGSYRITPATISGFRAIISPADILNLGGN